MRASAPTRTPPSRSAVPRSAERSRTPTAPPTAASPHRSQSVRFSVRPSPTNWCEVWSFPPWLTGRPSSTRPTVTSVVSRMGTPRMSTGAASTAARLRERPSAGARARPARKSPRKSEPESPMKIRAGG